MRTSAGLYRHRDSRRKAEKALNKVSLNEFTNRICLRTIFLVIRKLLKHNDFHQSWMSFKSTTCRIIAPSHTRKAHTGRQVLGRLMDSHRMAGARNPLMELSTNGKLVYCLTLSSWMELWNEFFAQKFRRLFPSTSPAIRAQQLALMSYWLHLNPFQTK